MNNSFEIEPTKEKINLDKNKNDNYSNKDDFNKLISDMRIKTYKNTNSIDNADNESTKINEQTREFLTSE